MANRNQHKNFRAEGFRPVGNPELAKAMAELGRSNAAQRHTPKPYKGTRTSSKKAAIKDYS